jgi:hypothetical protein
MVGPEEGQNLIDMIRIGKLHEIILQISEEKKKIPQVSFSHYLFSFLVYIMEMNMQYNDWRFLSYSFWRESTGGTWTVNMRGKSNQV